MCILYNYWICRIGAKSPFFFAHHPCCPQHLAKMQCQYHPVAGKMGSSGNPIHHPRNSKCLGKQHSQFSNFQSWITCPFLSALKVEIL